MRKKANNPNPGVLTKDEVIAKFSQLGMSFAEFARQEDFPLSLVYSVLHGRGKAIRGQSHNIAVALGMKHGVRTDLATRQRPQRKHSSSAHHGRGAVA